KSTDRCAREGAARNRIGDRAADRADKQGSYAVHKQFDKVDRVAVSGATGQIFEVQDNATAGDLRQEPGWHGNANQLPNGAGLDEAVDDGFQFGIRMA